MTFSTAGVSLFGLSTEISTEAVDFQNKIIWMQPGCSLDAERASNCLITAMSENLGGVSVGKFRAVLGTTFVHSQHKSG